MRKRPPTMPYPTPPELAELYRAGRAVIHNWPGPHIRDRKHLLLPLTREQAIAELRRINAKIHALREAMAS